MCFPAQQSALVLLIVNSVFGSHLPNTSCPPTGRKQIQNDYISKDG